jgi:hypothetical protein
MKQRVYIETTIVSYLTSKPSRDLIVAAHQAVTREWWEEQREQYELCTSELVLAEAARGDFASAGQRLQILSGMPLIPTTDKVTALARSLVKRGLLPEQASADAMHLALATVDDTDILLTWNCRHLANPIIIGQIGRFVRTMGYELPTVCTPDEFLDAMSEL